MIQWILQYSSEIAWIVQLGLPQRRRRKKTSVASAQLQNKYHNMDWPYLHRSTPQYLPVLAVFVYKDCSKNWYQSFHVFLLFCILVVCGSPWGYDGRLCCCALSTISWSCSPIIPLQFIGADTYDGGLDVFVVVILVTQSPDYRAFRWEAITTKITAQTYKQSVHFEV